VQRRFATGFISSHQMPGGLLPSSRLRPRTYLTVTPNIVVAPATGRRSAGPYSEEPAFAGSSFPKRAPLSRSFTGRAPPRKTRST